jgi:hypothetical protein
MDKNMELYNNNNRVKDYVDRYMKNHTNIKSVEDALKHSMVRSFIQYVEGGSR